jgi:hypothetical protein
MYLGVTDNGIIIVLSYQTIVGYKKDTTWFLTKKVYSRTTTMQIKHFAAGRKVEWVEDLPSEIKKHKPE